MGNVRDFDPMFVGTKLIPSSGVGSSGIQVQEKNVSLIGL